MKKILISLVLIVLTNNTVGSTELQITNANDKISMVKLDYKTSSEAVRYKYNNVILPAENEFLKAKEPRNDEILFSALHQKYLDVIDNLNDKYYDEINPNDIYYKNNWIKVQMTEGSYFYSLNYKFLNRRYSKYLSPAYKKWLNHLSKTELLVDDAAVTVPADKLRQYIIYLENFINNDSNFPELCKVKERLELYIALYLISLDNTPIFDIWDTKEMKPEYKASYEKFLSKNKNSEYYPMVEELYNKSKEYNFKWNDEFSKWFIDIFSKKLFTH